MNELRKEREVVVYILPSLKVGGVETAIGLSYQAISAELEIEYVVLDSDGLNPKFAPASRLSSRTIMRLVKNRKRYILVTSLWRAHLVGLLLGLVGVHWVAFFHNAIKSGHWLNRFVCKISARLATSCFFDSRRTQFEFEEFAHRKLGPVIPFVFRPPPKQQEAPDARRIDLIFVGRYVPDKRIDLCLKLIEHCVSKCASFNAAFVGYGELEHMVNSAASTFPNNIHQYGLLSNDEVRATMRKSKMILCLSDVEGMAMAVIEGIQEGCAPVARLSGEMINYLDHDSAIVYTLGQSLQELASAVVELSENAHVLAQMNRKAVANIEQYTEYTQAFISAIRAVAMERHAIDTTRNF